MKKIKNKFLIGILSVSTLLINRNTMVLSEAKNDDIISIKTLRDNEMDFKGELVPTQESSSNKEYEYLGNKNLSKTGYVYKKGTIPVLISVPHSIKQPARGVYNVNGYKLQDTYTGAIGKILSEKTGAHIIYKSSYTGVDDNYVTLSNNGETYKTPYRNKIEDIIKNNEIKLVIDLHGFSSDGASKAIELGTNSKKNFAGKEEFLDLIKNSLKKHGFVENSRLKDTNLAIDEKFSAKVKNRTVTNYVATTLGVPAVQIELGSDFRIPKNGDMTNINKIINALTDVINDTSKYKNDKAEVVDVKSYVNIRKDATINSELITTAKLGSTMEIIRKYNDSWYQVKYNGKVGYAYAKYIKPYYQLGQVSGVSNNISLRIDSKESSQKIKVVNVNEKVQILNDYNTYWYKVRYIDKNGKPIVGYASKTYIKLLNQYSYEDGTRKY